jgi:GNAT superfamily N-acetyltransferase
MKQDDAMTQENAMTASYALNAIFASFPRIRLARPADVPAIRELHAQSLRGLARGHYDTRVIEAFLANVRTLDEGLIADGTYFVAEARGRLVGAGGWSTRAPRYLDVIPGPAVGRGVRARIHSVFVHPEHTRIGLGRCLMACRCTSPWATGTSRRSSRACPAATR